MLEIIKKQKTIRVYPSSLHAGAKDHAACINMMKWLRQKGFRGLFEVVYHDVNSHIILTSFGCPKDLPADYVDQKQRIRFVKFADYYQRFRQGRIHKVDLALTTSKSKTCNDDNHNQHPLCVNDALMMHAKNAIIVTSKTTDINLDTAVQSY